MKKLFAAVSLGIGLLAASGAMADCASISDPAKRLACYDFGAQGARFSDYPAEAFRGKVRMPDFAGRDKSSATYRTRIRDGIKDGPNFAGHLAIITIGCGAGCRFAPVVDLQDGKVHSFPLGGEDNMYLDLKYEVGSRLVRATWVTNERCLGADFVWDKSGFSKLSERDLGSENICFAQQQ